MTSGWAAASTCMRFVRRGREQAGEESGLASERDDHAMTEQMRKLRHEELFSGEDEDEKKTRK